MCAPMEALAQSQSERHRSLRLAEEKAAHLFSEVERRQLVRPGITEKALNTAVYDLAFEFYGIKKYWHKRIVRAGPNTLCPYKENPPDLLINENDIVFFDFGPVFEEWEADFGRTYVLGSDVLKLRIQREIEACWYLGKKHFDSLPNITGHELYNYIVGLAQERSFEYPQVHCGHLIGNFPHERIHGEEIQNYIHPENRAKMRAPDSNGLPRDWILEIHFVDRSRQVGGFFEQLLTVD